MSKFSPSNAEPVFVVGFYRSGTSLLHALLNRHPDLALMYECDVLKLWPFVRERTVHHDWLRRIEFWNGAISRHQLDPKAIASRPRGRTEAADALYQAYAAKKGARLFGEKSPYYHDHLPALFKDYPRARIIVLWRSPLDTLCSVRRAGETERFFARQDFVQRVITGMKIMAGDCARLRKQGVAMHELQYGTLVRDQHAALAGICKFLGLSFDERMTQLVDADISVLPSGEHHDNVRRGQIIAGQSRTEVLGEAEIALVKQTCENLPGAPWSSSVDSSANSLSFALNADELEFQRRRGARDAAVRAIYSCGPLWVFKAWRSFRSRRFKTSRPIC